MDKEKITKITFIVYLCFFISTFWWEFGFVLAIGIIIVYGIINWMIDNYNKEKRLRELEEKFSLLSDKRGGS